MVEKMNKQLGVLIAATFASAVAAAVIEKNSPEDAPLSNDKYCVLKTDLKGNFAGAEIRDGKSGNIRYVFAPSFSSNVYEGVSTVPRRINSGANVGKVYYAESGDSFHVLLDRKACVINASKAFPIIATVGSSSTPAIK